MFHACDGLDDDADTGGVHRTFTSWKEEYKPIAEKYKQLCKQGYKGWINDSYFSATGKESTYRTDDYIEWILPYKKYLEQNNIDLIVLRYPSRSDFAARVLASDEFHENPSWIEHYYQCLKNDIEIVDPMPLMWENRFNYPLFYFYGDQTDIHPYEGELKCAAKAVSDVLQDRYEYKQDKSFSLQKRTLNSKKYTYSEGHSSFSSGHPIEFDGLTLQNEPVGILSEHTGSPFLFLSSSVFGYKAMQEKGASVPHYASFYLQTQVDWKYQSGTANPMIRNLIASSETLNKRRVVIMVGSYTSWNSGPKIPKYFFEGIKKITFCKRYDFLSQDIAIAEIKSCKTKQNEDGSLVVSGDQSSDTNKCSIKISVPLAPPPDCNFNTSMIRVVFRDRSRAVSLTAYDNNDIIDFTSLPLGIIDNSDLRADLFVPLNQSLNQIEISISSDLLIKYTIDGIELWYY